jgi:diguanylate cyclase (GGDEF)-like protein
VISLTAQSLVIAGAGILVAALIPVRRLIMRLPPSPVRRSWYAMAALIVVFFVGYLGYAAVFWSRHTAALDLIVPVVFFLGACFVLLTGTLSLRTTIDVLRISVLERQASTDALTGVLNRRALDRRLSDEVARARRYSLPFSLLLFDVDHFKRINDNFGHPAGDRVLVGLAQIVTATLRETDIFARYGGEEFMIVAPHTTRSGVADLAERVRKRIESHDLPRFAAMARNVSMWQLERAATKASSGSTASVTDIGSGTTSGEADAGTLTPPSKRHSCPRL